jgi:hypothetical protein
MESTMKDFKKAVNQGALHRGKIEAKRLADNVYAGLSKIFVRQYMGSSRPPTPTPM